MEVSTHQKSFPCYSQRHIVRSSDFQSVCLVNYTFHADFMNCENECQSKSRSILSSIERYENASNNDDLFDESSSGSDPKVWRKNERLELTASSEMLRIRFPFQSISIRLCDFLCLQENDLLNDTIVDFYLNHIVEHVLPDEPNTLVTILPSVFWHNLSILHSGASVAVNSTLTDEQKLDARFGDILDFVKDFDFIDVDYIVVPVNEWEHWSLVIICHPFTASARMVCFDSQQSEDLNNMQNIAILCDGFLKYVWMRRRKYPLCSSEPMCCITPGCLPQQSNNFDCGLYIVEFARRFLLAPPYNLDEFNFSVEYPDFSIEGKRRDIQNTILSLCSNRELWVPILEFLNRDSEEN